MAKSLGYSIAVLWGVATVLFLLFAVLPGDPARMMLDQREDAEQLAAIRAKYGFDLPLGQQYLYYLNDLSPVSWHHRQNEAALNYLEKPGYSVLVSVPLGAHALALKAPYLRESFQRNGTPVSSIIADTLPNTAVLAVASITLAFILGVFFGVLSAVWPNGWLDRGLSVLSTLGMALPSFFSAILMAWLFGFVWSEWTGLSMTGSLYSVDDFGEGVYINYKNLILPALTLGIRPLAVITQLTRSSMLDVLSQDFVRTAQSKGLSRVVVVLRHALRNALTPVVTATSGWFASLLAGAVFVEYIFGWNGLGKEIVGALNQLDLPVVMGAVLVVGALFVLINLGVDVLYRWLDPRLKTT
ncbi:ABC transporter permease [Cryomorphaceae bacterium]|nr:ABC transporter permease [Cryomorphaceae bacterium]